LAFDPPWSLVLNPGKSSQHATAFEVPALEVPDEESCNFLARYLTDVGNTTKSRPSTAHLRGASCDRRQGSKVTVAKRYASFMIRWWRLDSGSQRVEIEHIQSSERALLDSLRSALEWISAYGDTPTRALGSGPDPMALLPGALPKKPPQTNGRDTTRELSGCFPGDTERENFTMKTMSNPLRATMPTGVSGPEVVSGRLKGQLEPTFQTLVSVLQGVALITLVSRVEATYQHFTVLNWILAATAFLYFLAVWNEYMMGYLAYIFMPALLTSVLPFAFLAVELFLAFFVASDERAYALVFAVGACVGVAQYLDTTVRVRGAAADNPIYPTIARLWWSRIGLTAMLAIGAGTTWALYDTIVRFQLQLAVAIVFFAGITLFLVLSVPFWNRALAYARGGRV
jgi:hypothetical protein